MNSKKLTHIKKAYARHTALAVAVAMGFGFSGHVFAQSTTGSIFGTAPVVAGETVRVVNNQTGLTREAAGDSSGRYRLNSLPVGKYTVSLVNNGQVASTQSGVSVSVGGGTQVPFVGAANSSNAQNLSSVTVTANSIPAIDVSSTRQSSVISSQDLKVLPVGASAEGIALLAPGTASGASVLGTGPAGTPLLSFSGDSVVENAYYINGFNTTDPVGNAGGIALPYFAIAEQQTITSGYGAEYGRSTGGVISQVGQRGGNEFHAGAYVSVQPSWAEGNYDNIKYNNPLSTTTGKKYGDINTNRQKNSDWATIYDAYVSGPLIKDKLFFYITAEAEHTNSKNVGSISAPTYTSSGSSLPKFYGKLDWNINDSNVLELTGIESKVLQDFSNTYGYSYATHNTGAFQSANTIYSNKFKVGILKYTSYITDNLTLSVLYGKMRSTYFDREQAYSGFDPLLAGVVTGQQNPSAPGYGGFNNNPTTLPNPGHTSSQSNLRLDMEWKITAEHDVKFGIDNVRSVDHGDGSISAGPGYYWAYDVAPSLVPTDHLLTNPQGDYVNNPVNYANGAGGYYVNKVVYGGASNFTVEQKAQYVEDNWQVTPNLLLNLGVRNDQFTNYNPQMIAYVRQTTPQWQPRLGFSWDIFGDSTSKLYGNVGRYYLALPSGLGVRTAGANSFVNSYYTYASIDANGIPQGLTPIFASKTPFSADGEYGQPKDPKTVAATDLKPEYEDKFVLGFQKQLGNLGLVWTSQVGYATMKNIVDDVGAGITTAPFDTLVNPGRTNTIRGQNPDGSYFTYLWDPKTVQGTVLNGYPPATRKYYSLEEALEHPWDGKWMGKIDYVFARSYGTTEGPTDSALGQISNASGFAGGGQSGSITEAWDFPELMQNSNGEQANSHRHTLKAYGTYAITPEWLVSGLVIIQSGAPFVCLGNSFGPTEIPDPIGYGNAYHWCGGKAAAPGAFGNTPWIHLLNLSVNYIPEWAGKHLSFQVQVHNVLDEQHVTQYNSPYGSTSSPHTTYKLPLGLEAPRYVQFSAKYDF
jgi:hypothetical protein